ncbi:hypothetical protein [Streptomyces sp. NPDC048361]|uniref:hypothetical protein n=1 Tax=Streptomyces sp. NPDC048361 TaxID=3154720 RepID=UPI003439F19A
MQQFGESVGENITGAVTGLVDLFRPGEKGQATRKGLFMTIVGAEDYLMDPDGKRPKAQVITESRAYAKEFGKSLVGWDDWKTNPGKATGTVVFNLLTFASGPLGAASKVGKAGEAASVAARTAGVVSKVGEVLDPIGATAKVVGTGVRALPKVSELAKNIAAVTKATSEAHGVHSIIDLKGGSTPRRRWRVHYQQGRDPQHQARPARTPSRPAHPLHRTGTRARTRRSRGAHSGSQPLTRQPGG